MKHLTLTLSKKRPVPPRHLDDEDEEMDLSTLLGESSMLDPYYPVLRIRGEFNDEMARDFIKSVGVLQKRGTELAILDISSHGGSVFALFEMLNCMAASGMAFATYNSSHAYSAGAFLLASGEKGLRFAAPLSSTMIHPMSLGMSHQQIEDLVTETDHFKELNEMLMVHLAKNMGVTRAKLSKLMTQPSGGGAATLWMAPEAAKAAGVIDQIGIPAYFTETKVTVFGAAAAAAASPKKGSTRE